MTHVGFRPAHPLAYRLYNIAVATALLVASFPVFLSVVILLLATQGPSIFYRGERIGRNFSLFHILKFRTLCDKRAAALTKDRTLPKDADIFTPLGRFLRDTRIDELPQLLNVIKGDMNICGPRPVRAEIRAIHMTSIPGYDTRFDVRPGLLGPTQAYFGHGSSKRIRARMNNANVSRPVSLRAEIALTLRIIFSMIARILRVLGNKFLPDALKAPVTRADLTLTTLDPKNARGPCYDVQSFERDTVKIPAILSPSTTRAELTVRLRNGGLRRANLQLFSTETAGHYIFEPTDETSAYVVDRYALGNVVVPAAVNRIAISAAPNPLLGAKLMASGNKS
ncbi:sugar transferase [Leisingera sp. S232]|uniref:sugar transferase n=1 Tax=Leisingera sp. S232 TaxID=3415132 RepID=UPI003C7C15CF